MLGMPERALTQEVGIEFSKGSWKKQLNQAKRQKKLVIPNGVASVRSWPNMYLRIPKWPGSIISIL